MARKKFTQLPAAAALTGAEIIAAVQDGVSVQTTTQDIADLGGGGGGGTDYWRGAYAGASGFPTTGGNGPAGVPGAGDEYRSTNAALSIDFGDGLGPVTVPIGTMFKAFITTPGQTVANWKTW